MTDDCQGCEGTLTGMRRRHTTSCRLRLETEMLSDERLKRNIESRNERKTEGSKVVKEEKKKEVESKDKREDGGDHEMEVDRSKEVVWGWGGLNQKGLRTLVATTCLSYSRRT